MEEAPKKHKSIAIVGRIPGDDNDTCIVFSDMTDEEARVAFAEDISEMAFAENICEMTFSHVQDEARRKAELEKDRANNIREHGGDLGVFIEHTLVSDSQITNY